jgi:hypothetical protein
MNLIKIIIDKDELYWLLKQCDFYKDSKKLN